MGEKIKLASIHAQEPDLPAGANPEESIYDLDLLRCHKQSCIDKMCSLLNEAGCQGADLVCTHECFEGSGIGAIDYEKPDLYALLTETIPGPISERLSAISRKHAMNIVANYHEREGRSVYNTSVLLDRKGNISGKYRKIHLPAREKWSVTAGREFTVLQSDVGQIGFAICYDMCFTEHCRAMALNGANIIIHQTMGWGFTSNRMGEALLRTRAADNCVYLIVAKNIQDINADYGKSCVIDNNGEILAEAGGKEEKIVMAEFVPDFDRIDKDGYNTLFSGMENTRLRNLLEREPQLYQILANPNPPVMKQYAGLELDTATAEGIARIYAKWRQYEADIAAGKPVERHFHW
ncbi:MAG: carbon-nitrogen hydrolase family protein [Bacillota bacterium]|nr:carbon-nitrogen hydrolase family protein [Bacillota bacterium]